MSSWHRDNPELMGTDADPWMMHADYARLVTPREAMTLDAAPPDDFQPCGQMLYRDGEAVACCAMQSNTEHDHDANMPRDVAPPDDRFEPCPYCLEPDVYVHPDTDDGVCPGCDRLVDFDPVDDA